MKKWFKNKKREGGAITVMTAIMLIVVIGFTALSVDIGLAYYQNARLQNAVDAAATAVAGSLGSIDTSLEDVAYEYLKRNGFDKEKYGYDSNGDPILQVDIDRKGEVDLESVDDETYIKAGYYKLTVSLKESTLLGRIVDIDSLNFKRTAYVKAEANYVAMPRALGYTIFAGSTKGTRSNPAAQLNGRTSLIFNAAIGFVESGINLINEALVQPLIGFFGGNADYNELVRINLSEIVDDGDVHSNSNIGVGVQALNISRLKDRDYEGEQNIEAYEKIELDEEDYEPAFRDYGQVTFTACDDIRFNYLLGTGLLHGGYQDSKTRIYVQNQQYIEITQSAIGILDLIDFDDINSTADLRTKYASAATLYLSKQFNYTEEQKDRIIAQANNFTYDGVDSDGKKKFTLTQQGSVVYKIKASEATGALEYMREKGIDGLYSDLTDLEPNALDLMTESATSNTLKFANYADKSNDTSSVYSLIKRDEEGDVAERTQLTVTGKSVSRDYTKLSNNGLLTNQITTGMRFAVARSFVENSEYIEIPNLKPYFTRQVNKSIRNATKSREKINVSDAGQKSVKAAVAAKTAELNGYLEELSFEDKKYDDPDDYAKYDKTVLFKTFKAGSETGLTKLNGNSVTISGSMMNYTYSNTMTDRTYKGFQLYDSNDVLKTPVKFVQEFKNANTSKYAGGAINSFYNSTAKSAETAVADKKTAIINAQTTAGLRYVDREELVKNAIKSVNKPNMTTTAQEDPTPEIDIGTLPNLPDVFLGYGTTGNGVTIPRTSGVRKSFDDFVKSKSVTVSTDTFTAPAMPTMPSISTSGGSDKSGSSELHLTSGTYKNVSTPTSGLFGATKYDIYVDQNQNVNITGTLKIKGGKKFEVQSGATVKIGGKVSTDGNSDNKFIINSNAKMYCNAGSEIYSNHSGTEITVNNGGELHAGKLYFDAENHKLNVNSGGKAYIYGNVEVNDQKDELNVWGYCQINGDLKTVKDGTLSSDTRNFHVNVKNGGVLVVKGSIDFTHTDYLSVESGGTLIVQNGIKVNKSGTITVAGNLIQLNASSTIDTSSLTINSGGKIYAVGTLNSSNAIAINSGYVYTLSNISGNNDNNSGSNAINVTGTSYVYVRGCITSGASDQHIYLHDGTGSVVSVLGQGYSDCFSNIGQIWNEQAGSNIYLGKNTTVVSNNGQRIAGSIYCYGTLTFNTNSTINITGSSSYSAPYKAYVTGNFNATEGTLALSQKYLFCVLGNMNVKTANCDDSKITVSGTVTTTNKITLSSGGVLEGLNGIVGTVDDSGGTIIWPDSITFENSVNASNIEDFLHEGDVTLTGLTLTDVRLKIDGDLTVNGNIRIKTTSTCSYKSQLYVTGHIYCSGIIEADDSEIYADLGVGGEGHNIPTYIGLKNNSLLLCRKRNLGEASSIGDFFTNGFSRLQEWFSAEARSNVYCNGTLEADNSSRAYVEGKITAKSTVASGTANTPSYIYGFYAVNITESADSDGNTGRLGVSGKNSILFCGEKSSCGNYIPYIYADGYLYYPTAINSNHVQIASNGYAVFLGNVTANNYYLVDSGGYYYCEGVTKIANCCITNNGKMYLIGGIDYSTASKLGKVKTKDNLIGDDEYTFYCDILFGNNSESYIGHSVNGNGTFTFTSQYEGRGNVYFEDSLQVNGYIEAGDKNFDSTGSGVDFPNRGVAVYIPNGTTYVDGDVNVCNDNAIYIKDANGGLIVKNNINYGCAIYNYGKLYAVTGNLNLRSSATWVTDKKEQNKQKEGMSIKNGDGVGSNAQIYVGGTNALNFLGYIRNYGYMYLNASSLNVKGYCNESNESTNDEAFINYEGAQCHVAGPVALNTNQLLNKAKYGNRETIFACGGKLTYGHCLFNCGTVYADGDITNNETTTDNPTDDNLRYLSDSFSVLNGMYSTKTDAVLDNFRSTIYPEAVLYCTGKLETGVSEVGGESGSILSVGTMYVGGDMNIFTNGPYLKINISDLFSNKGSHSYFRTGLWALPNSNTFVGGNTFIGAGCAVGEDAIFMTGGDLRVKRSIKLNEYMYTDSTVGIGKHINHDGRSSSDPYHSSYMYVGGTAFVNTIGSTTSSSTLSNLIGVHRYPQNCSRDTDIFPNSNVYIGGWWYNNAKLYIKENVSIMVAGKGNGFYKSNGQLLSTIYQATGDLQVPEKQLTNGVAVLDYLYLSKNKHQPCKLYIYQCLDISPCSKLIVHGGGKVRDTAKIRDMTKTYFYGDFDADEYFELGKATDGADETEAKEAGFKEAGENNTNYEFSNSAYMYVGGDFTSGSAGVINSLLNGKLFQIFKEAFFSTGYTKVYASSTLKCKGAVTSNKYITLRHDARIYSGGDMTAKTSIEGGNYSEFYVGGNMTAGSSALTTIIDSLDILDLSNRGTINLMEQVRAIVGGDMYSTKHIQIGELAAGSYTRGRKTNYGVGTVTEGTEGNYNNEDITEKVCPECGEPLDDAEMQNHHCSDCDKDFDPSQFDAAGDSNGTSETISDAVTVDTSTELAEDATDDAYGANVFIQGSMVALNGHIKEFAYSSIVVGRYVYAPDYITLRHNADLWVMPETFGNSTYQYLPFAGTPGDTLISKILYYIQKLGYEIKETFKFKEGSVYTLSKLTLNMNASLMGTYDCWVPGQCVLRKDSLVYFGHDFTCTAPSFDVANGASNLFNTVKNAITGSDSSTNKPMAGFDSEGSEGAGYRYTCKNKDAHGGYWYHMTTRKDEVIEGTLVCDTCGEPIDVSTRKEVRVPYPAIVYANNKINIITSINMRMTYLVANKSDVNLYNVYTNTAYDESVLKELPNAIASYYGNINYFAMYGKLACLFYAPQNNIDFDGYYSEIWGCILGDTVTMNCYYQAFHRFNNWRTMDLHIAESGSVFLIPQKTYEEAPDNVDPNNFIYDSSLNPNLPEGAQIFFD